MSVVAQLEQQDPSPLASARLQRKLTIEEAGRRAGLTSDQIEWLEEGRVYRFPSTDDALVAVLLYATALGVDQEEARGLARLPVEPRPARYPRTRIVSVAAGVVLLVALAVTLLGGFGGDTKKGNLQTKALPPTWKFRVDVLNGGGDIYYTRALASKIGALGYKIKRVAKANRFDYPSTAVYFEPGGDAYGNRLARQLGVQAKPLPGGSDPHRLVVIAGSPRIG
jgi:transcriptional regulator with XRE-family HTH domain